MNLMALALLSISILADLAVAVPPVRMVADINTAGLDGVGQNETASVYSSTFPFFATGDTFFFLGNDGISDQQQLWRSDGSGAGTHRVAGLYPMQNINYLFNPKVAGNRLFWAMAGDSGQSVWTTDGTASGTYRVKDFGGYDGDLAVIGSDCYFFVLDGDFQTLYKSDGTAGGTVVVKELPADINAYQSGSVLTVFQGQLFFTFANTSGMLTFWRSDGTETGTEQIVEMGSSADVHRITMQESDGRIFIQMVEGAATGSAWMSDGTASGTAQVYPPPEHTALSCVVSASDGLFMISQIGDQYVLSCANSQGVSSLRTTSVASLPLFSYLGSNLEDLNGVTYIFWPLEGGIMSLLQSDGTTPGTVTVLEGNHLNGIIETFSATDNAFYFIIHNPTGALLWRSDGTPTGTYALVPVGISYVPDTTFSFSYPQPTPIGDKLFFINKPADGPSDWYELYVTDGTVEGTKCVKESISGSEEIRPASLTAFNGLLYFSACDATHGRELWKSDGTESGTVLVKDINLVLDTTPPGNLVAFSDGAAFGAHSGTYGNELFFSDGTEVGTHTITNTAGAIHGSVPIAAGVVGGKLIFSGLYDLYATDGTAGGTIDLGIRSIEASFPWQMLVNSQGIAFIASYNLVRTDGTLNNTSTIMSSGPVIPGTLALVGDDAYVCRGYSYSGYSLWKAQSSATLVKDLGNAEPSAGAALGSTYYFINSTNQELWKSDGTSAGTQLVTSLGTPSELAVANNYLFFTKSDTGSGIELWCLSEGGASTSFDIRAGIEGSSPANFYVLGETVYFTADDGIHGQELWKSNGTLEGTQLVKDIRTGSASSAICYFSNFNGTLFFFANDGIHGLEPWLSNGSNAGTLMLWDIRRGPSGSAGNNPGVSSGDKFFFPADDGVHGPEIWVAYDYVLTDIDGDGIPNILESTEDTDRDGFANYLDADSDNDGLADGVEGFADIDGDGRPNCLDIDSDGDGVNDRDEITFGSDPYDADSSVEVPISSAAHCLILAVVFTGLMFLRRRYSS